MYELQDPRQEHTYKFQLLKEGKTKRIWHSDETDFVVIENTDRITANNGLEKTTIYKKGWYATQISNICFRYLHENDVQNHYAWAESRKEHQHMFWARKLAMFPLEFVVRYQPYGSYLARYPNTPYFDQFPVPVIEIFEKDDERGDPYMHINYERETVSRFFANLPLTRMSLIDERPFSELGHLMLDRIEEARSCVLDAALVLKKAWEQGGNALVDIKLECGVDDSGRVILGDSIDADCWRLWRNGDPDDPLDRQLFKNNCHPFEIIEAQKFILKQTMQWLTSYGGSTGN